MPNLLEFQPLIKRIRWGGTRLGTLLGKPIGQATDAAESWEVCDHGADQSVVVSGAWNGRTLAELVRDENRALFGRHAGRTQFPLLVKLLDATDRLSLQVHPNDAQARAIDPVENGKTEAWVIVDAAPGSVLYAGLKAGIDREALSQSLRDGTLADCLHSFEVQRGDCVFIPAGTVHAIGEGILLAEVQQSSDVTFRLHDWGRLGTDGKPRPLHVKESLACVDFTRGPVNPVTPKTLPLTAFGPAAGSTHEELLSCPYFTLARHSARKPFSLPVDERFHVLMALSGAASVRCGNETVHAACGGTLLATSQGTTIEVEPEGDVVLLEACLPNESE